MIICEKCAEDGCTEIQRVKCALAEISFEFQDGMGFKNGYPKRQFTTEENTLIQAVISTVKAEMEELYE